MRRRSLMALIVLFVLAALAGPLAITLGADRGSASFGDNETLGLNRLESATVAVEVGDKTVLLDGNPMAPGDRVTGEVVLENAGTLPLRYALTAETAPGNQQLLDVLLWQIWPASEVSDCADSSPLLLFEGVVAAGSLIGDPAIGEDPGDRLLQPGASDRLCLEVELPIGVPDSFQGAVAQVGMTVVAEQATEDLE